MRDGDDKTEPSRRQLARKQRRDAGDLSGDLARTLMTIKDAALAKLRLDEDIAEIVARARKVTSPVARRRAERSLAGELRRFELEEIAARISSDQERTSAEPRLFHAAEQLRTKLIESDAAIAEVPGGATEELT
jgi:ribosome-associated protein